MFFRFPKINLLLVFISALFLPFFILHFSLFQPVFAINLDESCQSIINNGQGSLSKEKYQNLLKECQNFYSDQVKKLEADVNKTGAKRASLKSQIYYLNRKIRNLNYQIYQTELVVKDLGVQIKGTEDSIEKTSLQIKEAKKKLAGVLKLINEEDKTPIIEVLFSEKDLSNFFNDLMALKALSNKSKIILSKIKSMKIDLENQKNLLNKKKVGLEQTIEIQNIQKQKGFQAKKEQEYYLSLTEKEYQKKLAEKEAAEKKAAAIRAKIYELIGVRKQITYKEALSVAKYAALEIGIRPALLLGILSQESAIGRNVGQCYLKNPSTGSGIVAYSGKQIQRVMSPIRDVPHFLSIIKGINRDKSLNLNPFHTLVSCPMSFGWGGAMGPAQFIPSTWDIYRGKIKQITGLSADPWDIRDAALAASMFLKEKINRYGTEGSAIQSYFCGSPRNTYWCRWYERNVLYLANCHQQFIDHGSMSLDCQRAIGLR